MFKLLSRYIKIYLFAAIAIISLLFIQANFDLLLPNYMARIVNVGIQQGGLSDLKLEAISASTFENLSLLLTEEELTTFAKNYQYHKIGDPSLLTSYPLVSQQAIYQLCNQKETALTEDFWLRPLALYHRCVTKQIDLTALSIDETNDIFVYLRNCNDVESQQLRQQLFAQLSDADEASLRQSAFSAILQEYAFLGVDSATAQQTFIFKLGGRMLLTTLVTSLCAILVGLLSARTAGKIARNIRKDVFTKVTDFSLAEFNNFSPASLITRSTNDITHIQNLIAISFRIVFYAPLLGVGALLNVIKTEASMVWIIGFGILAVCVLAVGVFVFVMPKFKIVQKLIDRLNLVARENLTGLLVVRAFGSEAFQEARFDQANKNLNKLQLFVNRALVVLLPLMNLIMSSLTLSIVWFGAKQVDLGTMQVGNIMAFIQYATQIIMSFIFIAAMFIMIPRASVSAGRIMEVLDTPLSILDPENPLNLPGNSRGEIRFENVSFKYPGATDYALKALNFTVTPGQTTALIGSTGSGKSSLVNLMLRLYDVDEGRITLDGMDIRKISQSTLRAKIGYVSQSAILFSGTIEDNLKLANQQAMPSDLEKAATIAQAHDFINEKPDGYQELLAQAATNLSGGQKQRLAIARALVKDASIYIFDDSFSALDFKTDAALRAAFKKQLTEKTLIIVSQRIGTIKDAQQIIVLEDGRIVGQGTHKQLLKSCAVYQEIAYSQLSPQELQDE